MKKILSFILVVLMLLTTVSCTIKFTPHGGNENNNNDDPLVNNNNGSNDDPLDNNNQPAYEKIRFPEWQNIFEFSENWEISLEVMDEAYTLRVIDQKITALDSYGNIIMNEYTRQEIQETIFDDIFSHFEWIASHYNDFEFDEFQNTYIAENVDFSNVKNIVVFAQEGSDALTVSSTTSMTSYTCKMKPYNAEAPNTPISTVTKAMLDAAISTDHFNNYTVYQKTVRENAGNFTVETYTYIDGSRWSRSSHINGDEDGIRENGTMEGIGLDEAKEAIEILGALDLSKVNYDFGSNAYLYEDSITYDSSLIDGTSNTLYNVRFNVTDGRLSYFSYCWDDGGSGVGAISEWSFSDYGMTVPSYS